MKFGFLPLATGLVAVFCFGCTSKQPVAKARQPESPWIVALKQDPKWPTVEAAARQEVLRVEGAHTEWSKAYCTPAFHTNRSWAVIVSLAYPDYRKAAHYCLLVGDNGAIAAGPTARGGTK